MARITKLLRQGFAAFHVPPTCLPQTPKQRRDPHDFSDWCRHTEKAK
jgi:hypothetical protein